MPLSLPRTNAALSHGLLLRQRLAERGAVLAGAKLQYGHMLALALLVCGAAGPRPASAALISVDLLPGDGLLTRDTNTGLDWAAPSALSMDQILSGGGGWLAQGFRFATVSEVCGLVNSYGVPAGCPGGATGVPIDFDLFSAFASPPIVQADGTIAAPPTRFDDGNLADGKAGRLQISPSNPFTGQISWVALLNVANTDDVGHSALVRPIPEPSSLLLLAPALSLVIARRSRGLRRRDDRRGCSARDSRRRAAG